LCIVFPPFKRSYAFEKYNPNFASSFNIKAKIMSLRARPELVYGELVEPSKGGRGNLVFSAFTGRTDGIAASPLLSICSKRMSKGLLAMTARLFMLNISSKHF
jgi:hypothetical protein